MKNRFNKIKREHTIIAGVFDILSKISSNPKINSIIPGRIKPIIGNYPKVALEFKVKTATGVKFLAKSNRAVQEVFIVTDYPDEIINLIKN